MGRVHPHPTVLMGGREQSQEQNYGAGKRGKKDEGVSRGKIMGTCLKCGGRKRF